MTLLALSTLYYPPWIGVIVEHGAVCFAAAFFIYCCARNRHEPSAVRKLTVVSVIMGILVGTGIVLFPIVMEEYSKREPWDHIIDRSDRALRFKAWIVSATVLLGMFGTWLSLELFGRRWIRRNVS